MSGFKRLTAEDVQRIEREIVYTFPARRADGRIRCEGKFGDLVITAQAKELTDPYGKVAQQAFPFLLRWVLHKVDNLMSGEIIEWYEDWTIVDGKPVKSSEGASEPEGCASRKCMGKKCSARSGDADTPHSLECQEQATYTFSREPEPEILRCEAAVAQRWTEIASRVSD